MRVYTTSYVGEHADGKKFPAEGKMSFLTISRFRRDGFCAMESVSDTGQLLLRPLISRGGQILLNAVMGRFGRIRAELRMVPDGNAIPGFELEQSIPLVGDGHLNHNGGGFGFLGSMTFYTECGVGCVVLTNSEDHTDQQVKLVHQVLDALIAGRLVARSEDRGFPSTAEVWPASAAGTPEGTAGGAFGTPYRPGYAKYTGNYRYVLGGWEPALYVRLAFALGYAGSESSIAVHEREGHLFVGDEPVAEHEPRLFFTASGEALDMRGTVPAWQNCGLRRID